MTRALLVDPHFSSVPIRQALTDHGIDVATVGRNLTGGLCRDHFDIDYSDRAAMRALLQRERFDYLIPGCTDKSYESCSALAADWDFPALDSPEIFDQLYSKSKFRGLCQALAIRVPHVFASQREALQSDVAVIIKPDDAHSGIGITRLDLPTTTSLSKAVSVARKCSTSGRVIIEEYVHGQLYSYSAFLQDRRVHCAFNVAEYGTLNPFAVDASYVLPTNSHELELESFAEKIANELGLECGLLHIQYLATNSDICLVEATRRCPGDLYSMLVTRSTGFPYAEAFGAPFIDQPISEIKSKMFHRYLIRHTVSRQTFKLIGRDVFETGAAIEAWVPISNYLGEAANDAMRAGILLLSAVDQADVMNVIDAIYDGGSALKERIESPASLGES